ncbi:SGNH/GDSL hydrolase family protein [Arthrobacter sp. VKM Ac-2550]|uniref:SGNH/GDSL hydrolase family protein n=1 Tax=Crystallibacter permensis TaxID=1938888 RepID=UPI002226CA9A|nr:SGNH/GDSL hydrolase family protein [Arthrobacter sp. VKM Ac-2550]MCW2133866.1 Lysophospholipase L1 [Arthrobacter sp. VKM Ac-2550]
MTFTQRFVALGDSFTEGVGDKDPQLPNGVRGWADRVAEQLMLADQGWGYANLAIRGKKIRQVLAEQIEPALALEPTLVTVYAGANDILRPSVDIDEMMKAYDGGIARLTQSGADVVMFTGFDSAGSAVFGKTRGRTAIYNEWVREIADKHGARIVDYWRMREFQDWRYWDEDRLHMSAAGHTLMAKRVLETLQADDLIELQELPALSTLTRRESLVANARWAREHVGPWIARRLRGVSSGDTLAPKYPQLARLDVRA